MNANPVFDFIIENMPASNIQRVLSRHQFFAERNPPDNAVLGVVGTLGWMLDVDTGFMLHVLEHGPIEKRALLIEWLSMERPSAFHQLLQHILSSQKLAPETLVWQDVAKSLKGDKPWITGAFVRGAPIARILSWNDVTREERIKAFYGDTQIRIDSAMDYYDAMRCIEDIYYGGKKP
jgi:hypothetical protein